MDPVSIVSLASGSATVGRLLLQSAESLWKFIEQARNVDQSIRSLQRETAGLSRTLKAISDALDQTVIKNHRTIVEDYALVWNSLDGSLHDCDETATMMQTRLQGLQSTTRTSLLSQVRRQYRLGLRDEEIRTLRSQIQTHSIGLQISLSMINVIASVTSPNRVIESICPRFDQLESMIAQLQPPRGQVHGYGLFQQRTQSLQRAAQIVLSSASVVIGDSRSAASVMSNYQGGAGSEMGIPLNPAQRERIQDWIAPPVAEEDLRSTSSASDGVETVNSRVESQVRSATDSEITSSVPQTAGGPVWYSEAENTFELDLLRRIYAQDQKRYQSKEYALARQSLTKAMTKAERLLPKSQKEAIVGNIKLLLAQVYLEMNRDGDHCIAKDESGEYICDQKSQEDLEMSEKLLLDLCKGSQKDFEELAAKASYTLCQVYSHQKRDQEAYDLCRRDVFALKARHSKLRPHDTAQSLQYRLFLVLLSHICGNRGDFIEASAYEELLKGYQEEVAQDSAKGMVCRTLEHLDVVMCVAFSPDGRLLASGSWDKTVRLWDSATGAPRYTLEGHSSWITGVAFSPDSQLLASGSYDQTVRLWDSATGAVRRTLKHSSAIRGVAFSPDGRLVASASGTLVQLWDSATGAVRRTLKHFSITWSVAFSPDGQLVASACDDNMVELWDSATVAVRRALKHSSAIEDVAFSPDGRLVASASGTMVRLWASATGAVRRTLKHSSTIRGVAFSPDGKLVASACDDKVVRLWDSATGASRLTLEGHLEAVWDLAFSPNGQLVASASSDKTVRLWDLATALK